MSVAMFLLSLLLIGCFRSTTSAEGEIIGLAMGLESVQDPPEAMGGRVEYARLRMLGEQLGAGLARQSSDAPALDGVDLTIGEARFNAPADGFYDDRSAILTPGPAQDGAADVCITRLPPPVAQLDLPSVDVGEAIHLGDDTSSARLLRQPRDATGALHYGLEIQPTVLQHDQLATTWSSGATWEITTPGALPHSELRAVPAPLSEATLTLPPTLEGVAVSGQELSATTWLPGPWQEALPLTWTPSAEGTPVTVVLLLLGVGGEGTCFCDDNCPAGTTCDDATARCTTAAGMGWDVRGELACTLEDDGEFSLEPTALDRLVNQIDPADVVGAVLAVARITEGTFAIGDAITPDGGRIALTPIRARGLDVIYTRLESP